MLGGGLVHLGVPLEDDTFPDDHRGRVNIPENLGGRLEIHPLIRGNVPVHFAAD